ncbi:MAG: hypothetical protein RMH75_06210 [Archaeoglobaceae archaeon]|nr:hypothetical protein [Archaeoglobaceae archaeon]
MDLIVFAIVVTYFVANMIVAHKTRNYDRVTLAISIAKAGVRFPCRFVKTVYGFSLNEKERKCVKEITSCERECEECMDFIL